MLSSVDPDEARRAARDILSGAEYSPPEESPVERAVSWLFDRLGTLVGTLTGGGPGSVIGWTIVLGLVGGAAWLLVRALQVSGVRPSPTGPGVSYDTESHRDASVWLAEADRLVAAGDFRGALRCRYQALLATVVTHRVVDDVPGRTAGEFRALVADRMPDVASDVDQLTASFEAAWYGGAAVAPEDLEAFGERCERVESAAARQPVQA